MESEITRSTVELLQVPLTMLTLLNLNGPLWPPEKNVPNNTCFDYIIVGGGTAGCVLANRLSENENHTVLVIEAGGDPPLVTSFPPGFVLAPHSNLDWNFTSVYDDYAAKGQNNVTKLTSGLVLGGTSTIDHFIMVRGCSRDFDRWADIVNDSAWNYENVLPYFRKKETLRDQEILNSRYRYYHGEDGPTGVKRQPRDEAEIILESFEEAGNELVLDVNSNVSIGYTQSLFIVADGVRQSTAYNYITPIRNRPNLYVLRYTEAIQIIFEGKRAVAVVAVRNNEIYVYRASREIILSAGVYNSPKLLMLSGVGVKEHLESFDIETIADLPVGNDYQDQVAVALVHRLDASIAPPPPETVDPTKVPFPVIIGLKALNQSDTCADYQVFSLLLPHDTPFILLTCAIVFQYRSELCDEFNNQNVLHNSLFTLLTVPQPKSRGSVRLASSNPFDKPTIRTGYFTDETDLDNVVKYIKDFIKVGNSTYFKEIGAALIDPDFAACREYTYGTDDYWRCYALNAASSVFHASSTCAIGKVVDSRFRVFDVTNLRVVDVSTFPTLTSGSPYESVLMMAEKASDMIKEDADVEGACSETGASSVRSPNKIENEAENMKNTVTANKPKLLNLQP